MEVEEEVVGNVQQDETFWMEWSLKSVLHPVNLLRSDLTWHTIGHSGRDKCTLLRAPNQSEEYRMAGVLLLLLVETRINRLSPVPMQCLVSSSRPQLWFLRPILVRRALRRAWWSQVGRGTFAMIGMLSQLSGQVYLYLKYFWRIHDNFQLVVPLPHLRRCCGHQPLVINLLKILFTQSINQYDQNFTPGGAPTQTQAELGLPGRRDKTVSPLILKSPSYPWSLPKKN